MRRTARVGSIRCGVQPPPMSLPSQQALSRPSPAPSSPAQPPLRQKRKPPRAPAGDGLLAEAAAGPVLRRRQSAPRRHGSPSSSALSAGSSAYRRTRSFAPDAGRRSAHGHGHRRTAHFSDACSLSSGTSAINAASLASAVASVDSELERWSASDGGPSGAPKPAVAFAQAVGAHAGRPAGGGAGALPALQAEVQRLRREVVALRRGAHVSERVDVEMRRVKRLWQEAEHRLLLLQSEVRSAQVTQRALGADLAHVEEVCAAQAQRIEELVRSAAVDHQAQRERAHALEASRDAARRAKLDVGETQLQMVAMGASVRALTSEVELLEGGAVAAEAEHRQLLQRLHAGASERASLHRQQLALWEQRASALIDAGPNAKLDLILMQGNADLFEKFREVLQAQRDSCDKEVALLRSWHAAADGRTREQLQAQAQLLRQQLEDVTGARSQQVEQRQSDEITEALAKVDEAGRAISQLETQLAEERRSTAARERAAAAAAARHREAVAGAVGELKTAAAQMDSGLSRVVALETDAVATLQRQEAFRARTARLLVLQCHRPTLARCYRAWRSLTAASVGAKLADGGAAHAIASLKNRSLAIAVGGGAGGAGGAGSALASEYAKATLGALEEEWARREAVAGGEMGELQEQLRAAKTLAAQAMAESEEQRARLDRQAASLASEGEAMRRASALAREGERKAERELERIQRRIEKTAHGGAVDAVSLALEKATAERQRADLRAQLDAATAAHAAEVSALRQQLTAAEMMRLRSSEAAHARERQLSAFEQTADQSRQVALAAAQLEAARRVEAAEAAQRDAAAALAEEARLRSAERAASAKRIEDLGQQLKLAHEANQRTGGTPPASHPSIPPPSPDYPQISPEVAEAAMSGHVDRPCRQAMSIGHVGHPRGPSRPRTLCRTARAPHPASLSTLGMRS